MKRPDGVTLIAIWHFCVAVFMLLGLCAVSVGLVAIWTSPGPQQDAIVGSLAIMFAMFVIIVVGAIFAAVGWGLWQLADWARIGALVLAILQLPGFPVGTVIGALTLWYLLSDPDAKVAFGISES